MWEQEVLELIGYGSSMLILVSLVITSAVKHRVVNGIGAVIFTVYAILIRSYPTVILNACLVAVDVWYLVKVLRSKISYTVISAELHESAVNMFLENNREDIEKFFLELLFTADKLDIIEKQKINVSVSFPEGFHILIGQGIDVFVQKRFTRDVAYAF